MELKAHTTDYLSQLFGIDRIIFVPPASRPPAYGDGKETNEHIRKPKDGSKPYARANSWLLTCRGSSMSTLQYEYI